MTDEEVADIMNAKDGLYGVVFNACRQNRVGYERADAIAQEAVQRRTGWTKAEYDAAMHRFSWEIVPKRIDQGYGFSS